MNWIGVLILVGLVIVAAVVFSRKKTSAPSSAPSPSSPSAVAAPDDSLRDAITGLYNRKHLMRRLQETMARCDRNNERAALILWDIDGFVDFNNRFGQKAGDEFLRKVADTIRGTLRIYDEAFRSGADEFCAILLPADRDKTVEVTRRVNDVVSRRLFRDTPEYAGQSFSISSGVVFYPSEHKLPEALLYAAGEALYQARSLHK